MAGGYKKYKHNKNTMPVTDGSPASIDLPLKDGQIDAVRYEVGVNGAAPDQATTIASFPFLELVALGESWCKFRMADLIKMNAFYGVSFVAGFIEMFFRQDYRTLITEREATSMNPQLLGNPYMRLYVEEGVVSPVAKQFYLSEGHTAAQEELIKTNPKAANKSLIYFASQKINILSSGDVPTDYTYGLGGHAIRSLNFEGANIERIVMFIDGQEEQDFRSLAHLNRDLELAGFFPQADTWHINFEAFAGSISGLFDPMYGGVKREIRFEIYTSDDTDIRVLVEQYNKPKLNG